MLLDIGTGGGEAILQLSDAALLLVGIDDSAGMIETALANRKRSQVANIRFIQMNARQIFSRAVLSGRFMPALSFLR